MYKIPIQFENMLLRLGNNMHTMSKISDLNKVTLKFKFTLIWTGNIVSLHILSQSEFLFECAHIFF